MGFVRATGYLRFAKAYRRIARIVTPCTNCALLAVPREGDMARQRAFISFDYDHDEDLRTMLAGQAKNPDSPFDFADRSVKEPLAGDWKNKVRSRIQNTDIVIVICGEYTASASGVSTELQIAQDLGKPWFLLAGRPDRYCAPPSSAPPNSKVYRWTWDNLRALVGGAR